VVDHAITLATNPRSFVHVLSTARIWGTALGLQHPGLYPTKREWQEQRDIVAGAVKALQRHGFETDGRVLGTRSPSKVIAREAARLGCRAIVIGWRPLSWWMTYLLQDEVWWLQRRSRVPVIHVQIPP
jgi:universal stress protein family protein